MLGRLGHEIQAGSAESFAALLSVLPDANIICQAHLDGSNVMIPFRYVQNVSDHDQCRSSSAVRHLCRNQ